MILSTDTESTFENKSITQQIKKNQGKRERKTRTTATTITTITLPYADNEQFKTS
jgi:hypothetical protein